MTERSATRSLSSRTSPPHKSTDRTVEELVQARQENREAKRAQDEYLRDFQKKLEGVDKWGQVADRFDTIGGGINSLGNLLETVFKNGFDIPKLLPQLQNVLTSFFPNAMADMDAERKRQQQAIDDAMEDEKLRVQEERRRVEKAAERAARNTPQSEFGGRDENADDSRPRENDAAHEAPSERGASSELPVAPDNGEPERTVSLSDESIEAVKEGSKEGVKEGSSEVEGDRQRREFETGENEKERQKMVETARQIDAEREVRQTAEAVPQVRRQPPQVQGETATRSVEARTVESLAEGNDLADVAKEVAVGAAVDTFVEKGRRTATPAAPEAAGEAIDVVADGAGKLAGTVGRAVSGLGKLLPVVGGIATAASALGTIRDQAFESGRVAMNLTGENDPVLGSYLRAQMATQRTMSATFDGLDAKDAQTIQNTLINNGVNFQSDEFDDAYRYSSDMVTQYGMDAGKAARRYAEAVQYGTMTVEDLDETMQALAKSAKDSGKSLEQLDNEYEKSVQKWEKVTGDLGDAYAIASEAMQAATEAGTSANGYSGYLAKGASLVDENNPLHAGLMSDEYDRLINAYMENTGITGIWRV